MIGTIKNIHGEELKMVSNAATTFIYKRAYKQDIIKLMNEMKDDAPDYEVIWRLGYIQHLQTKMPFKEILNTITDEDCIEWLEQFESNDAEAMGEILRIFRGQQRTTSVPKKKHRNQSAKQTRHF